MYIHEEKEDVHEEKEDVHEEKEEVHEEKEYVHEEEENVHEVKEFIKEEQEFAHEGKESDSEEDNPFSCYLCDAGFGDKASLRNHVEHCGKIFYCAKCNGNFKSKQNLEEHVLLVHDEKVHVFEEKKYDHEEKENVHEGKKYKEQIHEGKEYVHKDKSDGKECGITESPELKNTENVGKLLSCPVCNKSSKSYDKLYNHIKENHDFMKCGLCDEKFKTLMRYRIHNSREHKGKTFGHNFYCKVVQQIKI